ncbi:MAG TPA: hypothetical protein VL147_10590 [Devosia sp.]|nr:hypothetical protein [Devosia sp.]
MWKDVIKNTVLKPLGLRLGTMGAVWLLAGGQWLCDNWDACGLVTEAGSHMVMTYLLAVVMVMFDLVMEYAARRGSGK